jgi:hypothetical protein
LSSMEFFTSAMIPVISVFTSSYSDGALIR